MVVWGVFRHQYVLKPKIDLRGEGQHFSNKFNKLGLSWAKLSSSWD